MRTSNLFFAIILQAIALIGSPVLAQPASSSIEAEQLEAFLNTTELDQMLIEHLEQRFATVANPAARLAIAKRLASKYVDNLYVETETAQRNRHSLERLVQLYPDLATSTVRLSLLNARYSVAEKQFRMWWKNGKKPDGRNIVYDAFQNVEADLKLINRTLEVEYQEYVSARQSLREPDELESIRAIRTERNLLQSNYLLGWTSYFLGVLSTDRRKSKMASADNHFRSFLQIEPEKTLNDVPASWFDLTSDWNVRALAGLGMCQMGLDHEIQSKYCFDLINTNASSQQTRDNALIWMLNARLYLGSEIPIDVVLEKLESSDVSERGRTMFWREVLRNGQAIKTSDPRKSSEPDRAWTGGIGERLSDFVDRDIPFGK